VSSLVAWCFRAPIAAAVAIAALTAGFALGVPRLETSVGYRAFLGPDHPAIVALDETAARFGGGFPLAAVWSCRESPACEHVFDAPSLAMAHAVARSLETLPGVLRVDSPATSPLLVEPRLGLPRTRQLAPEGKLASDIAPLAARAVRDATWVGQIVSADSLAGALVVQVSSSDANVAAEIVDRLRATLAPFENEGFRFDLVGGPVDFVVAARELERASVVLVPVMVLLAGAILVLLFGRIAPALAGLAAVGVAAVWTLGLLGWLGWPQNSLNQAIPPLILVIGVCDAIHLLAAYASRLPDAWEVPRPQRQRLLLDAASAVGPPCLLTTLTTAAGLLSFVTCELESLVRFGVAAAWGVGAALLLSFTAVPLLAANLPTRWMRSPRVSRGWERRLEAVSGLSPRTSGWIVVTATAVALFGAAGVARLQVDARFEDLYGENSQVVRWVRGAARNLREAETLEIAVQLPDGVSTSSREALAAVASVEALAARPELTRPLSVLSPLRELHQMLHHAELDLGADADPERPGQLLRLLHTRAPGFTDLFVDREGGALRVSFQAGKVPQTELRVLMAAVRNELREKLPPGYRAIATGPLATIGDMLEAMRRAQLASFALAGLLVWGLIVLFFRSVVIGAMALIPTLLPILVTLGAMGWLGLALDVGNAMVAAVLLGLVVDDAIHLLYAYRRHRGAGRWNRAGLAAAVREVGRALVTTSMALAVGFAALAFSPWSSVANFGAITAVAVAGALVADLLVLPALLIVFGGPSGPNAEAP